MKIRKSNLVLAIAATFALNGCGSEEDSSGNRTPVDTTPPLISIVTKTFFIVFVPYVEAHNEITLYNTCNGSTR